MSRYKKRKALEILYGAISTCIGILLLEFSEYPAAGVPFLVLGSCWSLVSLVYMLFEYEEDDASPMGFFNFNAGQIDSDKYHRIK